MSSQHFDDSFQVLMLLGLDFVATRADGAGRRGRSKKFEFSLILSIEIEKLLTQ